MVACARRYLGVRFAHQGRSARGLDCLGLVMLAAQDAGVRIGGRAPLSLDVQGYGARPDAALLMRRLAAYLQPVDTPELGDILVLSMDGQPQHLAMVSDYPVTGCWGMIHAYAVARKVVEHRYDAVWQRKTVQIFRLPA